MDSRKKKPKVRDLSGRIFKTVDSTYSSHRCGDSISSRVQTSYVMTTSDLKNEKPFLESVRSRKLIEKIDKPSQQTISSVIKDYVIPLFNHHKQQDSRNKRRKEFGLRTLSVDAGAKTFLDEMLLSDKLRGQLTTYENQVKQCDKKIAVASNSQFAAETELRRVQAALVQEQTVTAFLKHSLNETESKYHYYKNTFSFIDRSRNHYKLAYEELRSKFDDLSRELHSERLTNDIR